MNVKRKNGLSPVIATALLISMALVLAAIIFLWAKDFIAEDITKDDRAIEMACEDVHFLAEARRNTDQLVLENTGSVPIYSVEMKIQGVGEIKEVADPMGGVSIDAGETGTFALPNDAGVGETIIVTPVLLGETETELWPYACEENYGVEAVVGA
jgi:flagellin-like protein